MMKNYHHTSPAYSILALKRGPHFKSIDPYIPSMQNYKYIVFNIWLIPSFPDLVVISSSLDLPKAKIISTTGHFNKKTVFINQHIILSKKDKFPSIASLGISQRTSP